ncbi:MAG TPA: hypothetical protein EYN27_10600 [Rhodospirillales bacterium]|nr:hypothetical protein [Rhodospirillales bacterium]
MKTKIRKALKVAIAFIPWLISIYLLYWFEYSEIWTNETAHRGKMSVAIIATGMGLSFLVRSRFTKHKQK